MEMTEAERREYAEAVILEHAADVELLSIHEMALSYGWPNGITNEDARAVHELIRHATVIVGFRR